MWPADVLRCVGDFVGAADARPAAVCRHWRDHLVDHHRHYRAGPTVADMSALLQHVAAHAGRACHLSVVVPPTGCVEGLALLTTLAWLVDWDRAPLRSLCVALEGPPRPDNARALVHAVHLLLRSVLRSTTIADLRVSSVSTVAMLPLSDVLWSAGRGATLRALRLEGLCGASHDLARLVTRGLTHLESLAMHVVCNSTRYSFCEPLHRLAEVVADAAPVRLRAVSLRISGGSNVPGFILRHIWHAFLRLPGLADLEMHIDGNPWAGDMIVACTGGASLRRLRLGLSRTNLTVAGFDRIVLPLLRALPALRALDVDASYNNVGDAALPLTDDDPRWRIGAPDVLADVRIDLRGNRLSDLGRARVGDTGRLRLTADDVFTLGPRRSRSAGGERGNEGVYLS